MSYDRHKEQRPRKDGEETKMERELVEYLRKNLSVSIQAKKDHPDYSSHETYIRIAIELRLGSEVISESEDGFSIG
jgi:hypothetical protein